MVPPIYFFFFPRLSTAAEALCFGAIRGERKRAGEAPQGSHAKNRASEASGTGGEKERVERA